VGEDDVIVVDDATTVVDISTDKHNEVPCDFFKPKTLDLLREVRKYTIVDETAIRLYLGKILKGLTNALSIDEGIHHIRDLQETLVFKNPVSADDSECNQEFRLSMPPGIENLGATCYLNTQLQCLAQNLAFLDGILSWKPSANGDDDRMTSVLTLFQDLLLRMNSGPHSIVNTLDFSNALGLDHFEQQDPNEFSRLFFDRMHDSFQGGENNKNLTDLLPRLFQGVLAYEITCQKCGTKSKRTEEFMDLNLPIVRREPIDIGMERKVCSFQSKFDTDVQHCLNEYCSDEMLDGENQYHCINCKDKCDAKRAVSFQTLPPVLNVQVRYSRIFSIIPQLTHLY
jgi:ubiquitin C-terminal hydrolase